MHLQCIPLICWQLFLYFSTEHDCALLHSITCGRAKGGREVSMDGGGVRQSKPKHSRGFSCLKLPLVEIREGTEEWQLNTLAILETRCTSRTSQHGGSSPWKPLTLCFLEHRAGLNTFLKDNPARDVERALTRRRQPARTGRPSGVNSSNNKSRS